MSIRAVEQEKRDPEREARMALLGLVVLAGLVFSPVALLIAVGLIVAKVDRGLLWRAGGGGLALVVVFAALGPVGATWAEGWRQAVAAPGSPLLEPGAAWDAGWQGLVVGWMVFLPLAPLLAAVADTVRDKRPGEEQQQQRRGQERKAARAERNATRPARRGGSGAEDPAAVADGQAGVVIAHKLGGERALPTNGRQVVLPFEQLRLGILCAGAPGSGKTETAMRLCWALAKALPDAAVAYIDGKGDRQAAQRFCGLMADAGRAARVWPNQPFDGWRGDPWAIYYRVLELGQYPTSGDGFHYRTLASSALRLAVAEHPDGPPRAAGQLLERLDLAALKAAHGPQVERELTGPQVQEVRRRYAAVLGPLQGGADGDWSWEDAPAAYVLIERQRMGREAPAAARFFFEDFAHFFTERKPRERPAVLVVDELTALAEEGGLAGRIEQARAFNTGLVLCPQSAAGMGPEDEAQRIRDAVGLTVLHRVNDPELLAQAAGTRMGVEYSQHYQHGLASREGSARLQHQQAIPLNDARALNPGVAFLIRGGRQMKAKIAQAPMATAPLPDPGRADGPEPPRAAEGNGRPELPY